MKQSRGGWNLKMKSRLRLKVCAAREKKRNFKMKSSLGLEICELRQGDAI